MLCVNCKQLQPRDLKTCRSRGDVLVVINHVKTTFTLLLLERSVFSA